jgi:hypothetical protein
MVLRGWAVWIAWVGFLELTFGSGSVHAFVSRCILYI